MLKIVKKGVLNLEYKIWKVNRFDDDILTELIATFYNLEIAKEFVNYQASIAESYAIVENGTRIYID